VRWLAVTLAVIGLGVGGVNLLNSSASHSRMAAQLLASADPSSSHAQPLTRDGDHQDRNQLVRLHGEVAPAVADALARGQLHPALLSPAQLRQQLTLTVVLRRSDQAGFARFLAGVTDPHSADFRHFISERALTARFGPSRTAYGSVRRWLMTDGMRVVRGSADRLTITVRASRASVERALHVGVGEYLVDRRMAFATDANPAIPARLLRSVQAIVGLSSTGRPLPVTPVIANTVAEPNNGNIAYTCWYVSNYSTSWLIATTLDPILGLDGKFSNYRCAADELNLVVRFAASGASRSRHASRSAATPTVPGAGEKLGLLELDNFHRSDVADFLALEGQPASEINNLSETDVDGGTTVGAGESEVLLDIDSAMSLAPGAQITVFDAPISPTDFVDEFNAMIDAGVNVISNSWDTCENLVSQSDADAIDDVLQQAAAAGISVLSSTGDDGSTCADGSADTAAVPSDSPHLTAVGGSSLTRGLGGTYGSETYWNNLTGANPTGAGGFGVSKYFPEPSYQVGYTSASGRSLPDIASNADPRDGYPICQADAGGCPTGELYGGTSVAAPMTAAFITDLDADLSSPLGELNPLLYPLGGTDAFHSAASMGSDFAHVGLGSLNLNTLLLGLQKSSPGPADTGTSTLTAEPLVNVPADGSTTDTIIATVRDATGNSIAGHTVTLTAGPHSGNVKITPTAGGTSTADNGTVAFQVTDTKPETIMFTAQDTTAAVQVGQPVQVTFVAPTASGGVISADPSDVANDGTSRTTISVYLQNALNQPASGKTVLLSDNGAHASIAQVSDEAVTDSAGVATFTATDMTAESVAFTAVDVSDGNLPVPGSAIVTFQPGGATTCNDKPPTPISAYTVATWASGIPYNPQALVNGNFTLGACYGGAGAVQFDSSDNAYIPDPDSGQIFQLGPAGGTASTANALPDTSYAPADSLAGITVAPNGDLYAAQVAAELDQLNPASGAIQQIVATGNSGADICGFSAATDPLSGDPFTLNDCTGNFVHPGNITRFTDPTSTSASGSSYTDAYGSGQITFAPNGTLYAALDTCCGGVVESISGTNGPSPPEYTTLANLPGSPSGVAVAATTAQGQATALYVTDSNGDIYRLDIVHAPATVTTIASGGGSSLSWATVGPNGCLYVSDLDKILKVSGPGCSDVGTAITLAADGSQSNPTGSTATLTATLHNFPAADGTPVHFSIEGPNSQVIDVNAGSADTANLSYHGIFQGVDTITAWALVNGHWISSAPVELSWTPGKDTSALTLNDSQETGLAGQPANLTANLVDLNTSTPISGASVTLSIDGQSCVGTTDANGDASCQVTPTGNDGLQPMQASYAGSSKYTPSTASNSYALGGLTLGPPPIPPAGGTPAPPGATPPDPPVKVPPPIAEASAAPTHSLLKYKLSSAGSKAATGKRLTTFLWKIGDKVISHAANPTYRFARPNKTYDVSLTVTETGGETGSATVLIDPRVRIATTTLTLSSDALFAYDSFVLTSAAQRTLSTIRAKVLRSTGVTIAGYCDSSGAPGAVGNTYNDWLSRERALAVADFLYGNHIPKRVKLIGYGRTHFVASNTTAAGRAENRRVVISYETKVR